MNFRNYFAVRRKKIFSKRYFDVTRYNKVETGNEKRKNEVGMLRRVEEINLFSNAPSTSLYFCYIVVVVFLYGMGLALVLFSTAGFISVAFAYECVEKACRSGRCISETTCTANATNGCVIYRSSGVVVHNCSSVPCVPIWSSTNGNESTADCCFSDRCNSDSMASNTVDDPAVDECYSITCNTVGCLNKSINEGKARLCPVFPNRKCMTTKVNERRTTTCSQLSCQAVQTESVIIECCTGNLCNTPTEDMFKTTAAPATTTTKKDTSGAGRLGHSRYIIYTLVTFLVSIIS